MEQLSRDPSILLGDFGLPESVDNHTSLTPLQFDDGKVHIEHAGESIVLDDQMLASK